MWRAVFPSALVLAGLLGRLGYAAANAAKPPAGKLLHVRVRAVDAVGKPIARALIEFWQSGGEGRSWWTARRISLNDGKEVRTGEDGWAATSFSMAAKPATTAAPRSAFCLTAQANNYLVTRSGLIDAAPSDHFEVVLTLRRLLGVEGRVVDQQGRPVAGATVFHTGNATPRTEVRTDPQGHFRIEGLPEGKIADLCHPPGLSFSRPIGRDVCQVAAARTSTSGRRRDARSAPHVAAPAPARGRTEESPPSHSAPVGSGA